jgi:GxxExxY protein
MTKKYLNELTYEILGAAIEVHKILGPGLLESVYHHCLAYEFDLRGIEYQSEMYVPVNYKEALIESTFRCDFLVDDAIVVELKAVDAVLPIHEAFLINYINLLEKPKGIMINFHCLNIFKDGQKTYVNKFFRDLPEF